MKIFSTCLLVLTGATGTLAAPKSVELYPTMLDTSPRDSPDIIERVPPRIVGGTVSPDGAYPWFARSEIIISQFGFPFSIGSCGAALIHPQVALSAFHCLDQAVEPGFGFSSITLFFGANQYDGSDSLNIRTVETAVFLEDYDFPFGDMVLYILDAPVTNIEPIAFNRVTNLPSIGSKAKAIGFGLTSDGGSSPDVLLEIDLDVVSEAVCNDFFIDEDQSESELICVRTEGVGTCQGDSGGPLIATVDGVLTTFGVVSFGGTCGESPTGYIATSHYQDFIDTEVCNRPEQIAPAGFCIEIDDDASSDGGCGDFLLGILCPFVFLWNLIVGVFDFLFGWL